MKDIPLWDVFLNVKKENNLMSDNSFNIKLQAVLDKIKSIANIKADIKAVESKLPKIKLQGTLNKTAVKKELDTKLKTVKPKVKIDADTTCAEKKIKRSGSKKQIQLLPRR